MGRLLILALSGFIAAIATVHFLPFYPELNPVAVSFPSSPQLVGPLAPNNALDSVEKLWSHLEGPESIDIHDGWIYTGTSDGNIHRLKGNIDEILIDRKCDCQTTCNRPLGVRFVNNTQDLYVADAVLGVYKVNIPTRKTDTLFDASIPVAGKFARLTDDLTVSRSGDIYFTDASTKWSLNEFPLCAVEWAPDGRILHYNPATKTTQVLVAGLYFPNGIQLSPDEEFIVFSEFFQYRLLRYYLKGPKKGKLEVFADNVPGFPDNVRASGRGTYWVAFFQSRFGGKPTALDRLARYPEVRSFLARLPHLFILPLDILDSLGITHGAYSTAKKMLGHLLLYVGNNDHRLIIEIDHNGKIIRSLHSPQGKLPEITQVTEHENTLYFGTVFAKGIRRLKL